MKRALSLMAVSALALTVACKQQSPTTETRPPAPPSLSAAGGPSGAKSAAAQAFPSQSGEGGGGSDEAASDAHAERDAAPTAAPQAPMLALAYKLGLVVPADQVRPLMESHQEACERAGADQCQVLGADASADGDEKATAELSLRATPAWMRVFRTRAEADAKDLGGRIDEAATDSDDLSTGIVDTEAAQRARADEEARLAQLMKRRTSSLQDTLAVEQEITRVQGEIDQAASELAAMKTRVVMQTVTVAYASPAVAAPKGDAAPLQAAERSFMGNVYAGLAALVSIASFLLPIALVGAPVAWWVARRKKAPAAAANPSLTK